MLMLGAGRPQQQQPMAMPVAQTPMAAPQAVPYSEAGFGYGNKLTPLEEIGMATAKGLK
jgi:hypothetical protein